MINKTITFYLKSCLFFIFLLELTFTSCIHSPSNQNNTEQRIVNEKADTLVIDSSTVYKTDKLIIKKLSDHIYEHTSFLHTRDFGNVPSNGMIVVNENKAVIFDTPADDVGSLELINYVTKKLNSKIEAVIPTHFHQDNVGGLEVFNEYNVPIYASNKTKMILKEKGNEFADSIKGFVDSLVLNLGKQKVYAKYFGEGHTRDNIVGYFPSDSVIFGGCLIKELGAGKGNLEDANTANWPETVRKLKTQYPKIKIVIPGHGKIGGTELFDYTIDLFK